MIFTLLIAFNLTYADPNLNKDLNSGNQAEGKVNGVDCCELPGAVPLSLFDKTSADSSNKDDKTNTGSE